MTTDKDIRDRFIKAVELAAANTTVKEICKRIKINYSYFSQLKSKDNPEIKAIHIASICKLYNISPVWLILGKGEPFEKYEETMKYIKRMDKFMDRVLVPLLEGYFKTNRKDIKDLLKNISTQ